MKPIHVTPPSHPELVAALVKPGQQIKDEVTADEMHLLHMLLGVCGEAGELLDALKKAIVYRKPLDRANVVEELGDLEFYMEGIRQGLGITREETLEGNIAKLSTRYAGLKYTNQAAVDRADKAPTFTKEQLEKMKVENCHADGRCMTVDESLQQIRDGKYHIDQ